MCKLTDIELQNKLEEIVGKENLIMDADMSQFTSFKAGGRAKALAMPTDAKSLKRLLQFLSEEKISHLFLGNGSNTLFRDKGYSGVVVKLDSTDSDFIKCEIRDNIAEVGTAVLMSAFAKQAASKGLSGFEPMSGIPGSLGGACFMNAGAYGGEMKDVVLSVHAISPDGKEERDFSNEEMQFAYRHSVLEDNGYIATSVRMRFIPDEADAIFDRMKDFTQKRNSKQPVQYPSAGSFFKRPEGYFAGKLIEDAGLKGLTVGGAQVSQLHSGFVINIGGATATDITDLMHLVQNTVKDKFGVELEPEVRIVGDE